MARRAGHRLHRRRRDLRGRGWDAQAAPAAARL